MWLEPLQLEAYAVLIRNSGKKGFCGWFFENRFIDDIVKETDNEKWGDGICLEVS